jgi:hypothetical protein
MLDILFEFVKQEFQNPTPSFALSFFADTTIFVVNKKEPIIESVPYYVLRVGSGGITCGIPPHWLIVAM